MVKCQESICWTGQAFSTCCSPESKPSLQRDALADSQRYSVSTFYQRIRAAVALAKIVQPCLGGAVCNIQRQRERVERLVLDVVGREGEGVRDALSLPQLSWLHAAEKFLLHSGGPTDFASLAGRVRYAAIVRRAVEVVPRHNKKVEVHRAGDLGALTLYRVDRIGMFHDVAEPVALPKDLVSCAEDLPHYHGWREECLAMWRNRPSPRDTLRKRLVAQLATLPGHRKVKRHTHEQGRNCFASVLENDAAMRTVHSHAQQSCVQPVVHLGEDGWRHVDVRTEQVRVGDALIYMNYLPSYDATVSYYKNVGLSEAQAHERAAAFTQDDSVRARQLPGYAHLAIQHAAVVTQVDAAGHPTEARHMFDSFALASLGDPFAMIAEYGEVFAVFRRKQFSAEL